MSLIDEILDLSKVEAGKVEICVEDMDLEAFACRIERNFGQVAKEKGLSLKINLAEELPAYIRTDKQKVEQIIKNLLSNALKFTERGDVTLSIHRLNLDLDLFLLGLDPKKTIAISVSDTGIGIPQNKQEDIFKAFQQADGATNRKYGGTGLGLSISRQLARQLGGEIQLQSEEWKGSIFSLYLPDEFKKISKVAYDEINVADISSAEIMRTESTPDNQFNKIGACTANVVEIQDNREGIHRRQNILQGRRILLVPLDT